MKRLSAYAPTRIDLAGGTLDIWPLNMLVNGALTVNVAIDLWATVVLEEPEAASGSRSRIEVRSEDLGVTEVWERSTEAPPDTRLPLVAECTRFFGPDRGFRLTTRCASPPGAGLGGSSALAISMLGALQRFLGESMMPPDEMVGVARDLEARVLGIPTGTQDHFAAVYGGAAGIRYGPGRPQREALAVDLDRLGSRLVLIYTGASRLSATANWDMVRSAVDGVGETRRGLESIASIAHEMRSALLESDLDAAGRLLGREWEERKRLSPKVTTTLTDKALKAALDAGALAGKVCGAGGGGCMVLFCKEGGRDSVEAAMSGLSADGVQVLRVHPTRVGLQLAG